MSGPVLPTTRVEAGEQPAGFTPPPLRAAKGYRDVSPMLCKPARGLPTGKTGWTYELQWPGVRCIAQLDGSGGVTLASGDADTGYTATYAQVAGELARKLVAGCILDGALVCLDDDGRPLPDELCDETARYMVFDCLEASGDNGMDLRQKPFGHRIDVAGSIVHQLQSDRVAVSPLFEDGAALLEFAAASGYPGIVAKKLTSGYSEGGGRLGNWLKIAVAA